MNGVKIAALCDPDARRVASKKKEHADAKTFTDLRKLIDDKEIDAVVRGDFESSLALPCFDLGNASCKECLCRKTTVAFAVGRRANRGLRRA